MRSFVSATAGIFALLALGAGCGNMPIRPAAGQPVSLTQLGESTWRAVEIEGQPVKGNHAPIIVFESRTRVLGTGGCNSFHAEAKGESVGVTFGPIASTRRACEPPLMDQEQRFFAALTKPARLERNMDLLFLIGDDGSVTLRFLRVFPPDADTAF